MSLKNKDFLCAMHWQHKIQLLKNISNSKACINKKKVFRYAGKSNKGVTTISNVVRVPFQNRY